MYQNKYKKQAQTYTYTQTYTYQSEREEEEFAVRFCSVFGKFKCVNKSEWGEKLNEILTDKQQEEELSSRLFICIYIYRKGKSVSME